MKVFIVETIAGFVSIPQQIGAMRFPLTYHREPNKQHATKFLTKSLALGAMKRHKVSSPVVQVHEIEFS